ncbi:hypothetical protein NL676_002419 [Syzygium grande]|nr:hypothetical protein NL676_002419 [Syzygium grande]
MHCDVGALSRPSKLGCFSVQEKTHRLQLRRLELGHRRLSRARSSLLGCPTGALSSTRQSAGCATGGESLNTSYLSVYLESSGPNFSNGANFTISGARTYPPDDQFNLGVQVRQFLRFKSRSPLLLSRRYTNLVGEDGFRDALYTIDIGQNNLAVEVVQNTSTFIGEIRFAIRIRKNFWVDNTGPLGCLPQKLATTTHNASDTDEHGCLKSLNDAAQVFNRQLQSLCEELRSQLKNATIVYVDVFAIKYDLIANYAEHGFESSLMASCGNFTVCDEGSRYVSWDGVHYT